MGCHISDAFSLLTYVEVPHRTRKWLTCNLFEEMVNILDLNFSGDLPEDFLIGHKGSGDDILDIVTLCHKIIYSKASCLSKVICLLKFRIALSIDRHRLVRNHMVTLLDTVQDIVGLQLVVAGKYRECIAVRIRYMIEEVLALIDIQYP